MTATALPGRPPAGMLCALYGRVSTDDLQDPTMSRDWQRKVATNSIALAGGVIVAEYFDVNHSRSLPWARRPEAARLLDDSRSPHRQFDTIVVAEPHRAFYGDQYGQVAPLLWHHRVALWVPELGGLVDPDSDAHDMLMRMYGGLSRAERNRVRTRVRNSMSAATTVQGRFLGGRPPYGYMIVSAGTHPNPSKAREGVQLHRLEPDPATAPIVKQIFEWRLQGAGLKTIAQRLNERRIPCPSAHDPDRNLHRLKDGWQPTTVREILRNERYTGRQVWNKTRRSEELIDENNVGAGYRVRFVRNPVDAHAVSTDLAHTPLISDEQYDQVQALFRTRDASSDRSARSADDPLQLRGRVVCDVCGRKMQSNRNHGTIRYLCRAGDTTPGQLREGHPKTVYVQESEIVELVDAWIADLFAPDRLHDTLDAMTAAQQPPLAEQALRTNAEKRVADSERKLNQLVKALETGGEPSLFVPMINKANDELTVARDALATLPAPVRVDRAALQSALERAAGVAAALAGATPGRKAELYAALGVTVVYQPTNRTVTVEISEGGRATAARMALTRGRHSRCHE